MDALTDVDAALEIDPANVAALVLAARCWYALGKFDAALDLLATARTHARNTDEVTAVLRWRETCELGLLEAVSAELGVLMASAADSARPSASSADGVAVSTHPWDCSTYTARSCCWTARPHRPVPWSRRCCPRGT